MRCVWVRGRVPPGVPLRRLRGGPVVTATRSIALLVTVVELGSGSPRVATAVARLTVSTGRSRSRMAPAKSLASRAIEENPCRVRIPESACGLLTIPRCPTCRVQKAQYRHFTPMVTRSVCLPNRSRTTTQTGHPEMTHLSRPHGLLGGSPVSAPTVHTNRCGSLFLAPTKDGSPSPCRFPRNGPRRWDHLIGVPA
jgi:hypothetical protein